ncbi:MAG: AI-2E family transporter [Balneolaceae bacterium]
MPDHSTGSSNNGKGVSAAKMATYTLVIVAVLTTTAFFWAIRDAFLIAFAGVILAVILNGFSAILQKYIPISRGWSLVSVCLILVMALTLSGVIFGQQIVQEFAKLTEQLPEQISDLRESISEWPIADELMNGGMEDQEGNGGEEEQEDNGNGSGLAANAGGMIFQVGVTIVDVITTLVLIIFIGIYFVIDPETYKKGVALLFTKQRADRINEALETAGKALWYFLGGQFIAMVVIGVLVAIGLMILGVPLALILGVIAGLSEFVPFIGPWVGAVPGVLLALSVDTQTAIYTSLLYLIVQQIESNILTPLIQRHMVYIPPAVVIISVVAFGLVFGIAGIILATPLAVVAMVLVGMFYVQDVLGKEVTIPGEKK